MCHRVPPSRPFVRFQLVVRCCYFRHSGWSLFFWYGHWMHDSNHAFSDPLLRFSLPPPPPSAIPPSVRLYRRCLISSEQASLPPDDGGELYMDT